MRSIGKSTDFQGKKHLDPLYFKGLGAQLHFLLTSQPLLT